MAYVNASNAAAGIATDFILDAVEVFQKKNSFVNLISDLYFRGVGDGSMATSVEIVKESEGVSDTTTLGETTITYTETQLSDTSVSITLKKRGKRVWKISGQANLQYYTSLSSRVMRTVMNSAALSLDDVIAGVALAGLDDLSDMTGGAYSTTADSVKWYMVSATTGASLGAGMTGKYVPGSALRGSDVDNAYAYLEEQKIPKISANEYMAVIHTTTLWDMRNETTESNISFADWVKYVPQGQIAFTNNVLGRYRGFIWQTTVSDEAVISGTVSAGTFKYYKTLFCGPTYLAHLYLENDKIGKGSDGAETPSIVNRMPIFPGINIHYGPITADLDGESMYVKWFGKYNTAVLDRNAGIYLVTKTNKPTISAT